MSGKPAVPPSNLDAEESVLGAMLLTGRAADAVADSPLTADDFYRVSHGEAFRAITALHAKGEPVDAITVVRELEASGRLDAAGGAQRIHELAALVPAAGNVRRYADLVVEAATFRELIRAGTEIARYGIDRLGTADEAVEAAEKAVYRLASRRDGLRAAEFVPASESAQEAFQRLQDLAASGRDIIGVPTGFHVLDRMTSGMHPGALTIVAARPSMGKTALALAISANLVLRHDPPVPVGLFTLEMNRTEVYNRLYGSEALVDSRRIQSPTRLDGEDWERIVHVAGRLSAAPLFVDDSGASTFNEIRSRARRLKAKTPSLGLLVLDYLQLLTSGSRAENRNAELSQISRGLKLLARELDVPVVALSQLSRDVERRHDKRPILADLRESGAIEQDADVVLLLYRDEYYYPEDADENGTAGVAEINVAKQRNGPTGTRKVGFSSKYARFTDLAAE